MSWFLEFWVGLIPVGIILLFVRDDCRLIFKDADSAIRSGIWGVITLVIITLMMPVTIPYSIRNILNRI
jgi:hypothetical protein